MAIVRSLGPCLAPAWRSRFALITLVIFVLFHTFICMTTIRTSFPSFPWEALRVASDVAVVSACIILLSSRVPRLAACQMGLSFLAIAPLLYSSSRCGTDAYLISIFTAFCVVGDDLRKLCRGYACAMAAVIVMAIALSIVGILSNYGLFPNGRLVFSFGATHPNNLGALVFGFCTAMVYSEWEHAWRSVAALCLGCGAFAYFILSSHASAILCISLVAITLVGHAQTFAFVRCAPEGAHRLLLLTIPTLIVLCMVLLTAIYDSNNGIMRALSSITHRRIHYAHEYYVELGGFTLFGRPELTATQYNGGVSFWGVDSGLCHFALVEGIVPLCMVTFAYLLAVPGMSRRRDFAFTAIVLLGFFYLVVEGMSFELYATPWLLFVADGFATVFRRDRRDDLPACHSPIGSEVCKAHGSHSVVDVVS